MIFKKEDVKQTIMKVKDLRTREENRRSSSEERYE